jgi:hypothetical protein
MRDQGNVSDCTGCRKTQVFFLEICTNLTREEIVYVLNNWNYNVDENTFNIILCNPTHFPGPLVCRIRQVPLYIQSQEQNLSFPEGTTFIFGFHFAFLYHNVKQVNISWEWLPFIFL